MLPLRRSAIGCHLPQKEQHSHLYRRPCKNYMFSACVTVPCYYFFGLVLEPSFQPRKSCLSHGALGEPAEAAALSQVAEGVTQTCHEMYAGTPTDRACLCIKLSSFVSRPSSDAFQRKWAAFSHQKGCPVPDACPGERLFPKVPSFLQSFHFSIGGEEMLSDLVFFCFWFFLEFNALEGSHGPCNPWHLNMLWGKQILFL